MAQRKTGNFVMNDPRKAKKLGGVLSSRRSERLKRNLRKAQKEKFRRKGGRDSKWAKRMELAEEAMRSRTIDTASEKEKISAFSANMERLLRLWGGLQASEKLREGPPAEENPLQGPWTDEALLQVLQSEFGYSDFRPGQLDAVRAALDGQRPLVMLPTGGGKSLIYQLVARVLRQEGVTLVVGPLLALMKDQIERLPPCLRGAVLCSELTTQQTEDVSTAAKSGWVDVLFVTPERMRQRGFLRDLRIAMVCVDEAHCVTAWSHSFRPAYLQLRANIDWTGCYRLVALTATATQRTVEETKKAMRLDHVVVAGTQHAAQLAAQPVFKDHMPPGSAMLDRAQLRP